VLSIMRLGGIGRLYYRAVRTVSQADRTLGMLWSMYADTCYAGIAQCILGSHTKTESRHHRTHAVCQGMMMESCAHVSVNRRSLVMLCYIRYARKPLHSFILAL